MSRLDIYYRAFKEYRRETVDEAVCEKDRKALALSNLDRDVLEATKYLCSIREDWIEAIEEGLEYVEKAVAEERQFIRTNGEVVPIEKVKKISKDSVEHLAKHSDLITHIPEDGSNDIIPDKLYMVEKLSDYAVYENRFLYMLLCYLNDFINFRLEKIEALRHSYDGNMRIFKEVETKKRMLTIKATVTESRTDNPYPVVDEKSAGLIQRIKDCQSIVNALLNTDLMVQVAKTPMIKPPITKTNVLKMNNNFKRALALYDYVATYKDDGYTYEEVHSDFTPFAENVADELAEAANLVAFIAYKFGNGIDELLDGAYEIENQRRKELEEQKLLDKIKKLRKRALESGKTMEEYMVLLEERNRSLERDSEELQVIRQEVETLNRKIDVFNMERIELNRRMTELQGVIEEKEQEIVMLNQKYLEDMAAARAEHELAVQNLNAEHFGEIQSITESHREDLANAQAEYEERTRALTEAHEARESELGGQMRELTERWNAVKDDLSRRDEALAAREAVFDDEKQKVVDECERKMRGLEKSCEGELAARQKACDDEVEQWRKENSFIRAELDGMRIAQGLMTPSTDYSSRERFVELEREFEAFQRFFKGQWKITKKEIKREVYAESRAKTKQEDNSDSANTEL